MKLNTALLTALLALLLNTACTAQTENKENKSEVVKAEKVEVFYFHFTRRCATCNAVESVTKEAVAELKSNNISFAEYNLDESEGKAKGESLEISGQSLVIVAGEQKIDITNEGFLNARSKPEKLKAIIKEKIKELSSES